MAAKKTATAPKKKSPPKCACCGGDTWRGDALTKLLCGECSADRERFAGRAAQALTSLYDEPITLQLASLIADEAFTIADAMLRRAQGPYAFAGDAPAIFEDDDEEGGES